MKAFCKYPSKLLFPLLLVSLVLVFGQTSRVLGEETQTYFLNLPTQKVDAQKLSEKIETIQESLKGLKAVQTEGREVAEGLSSQLKILGIVSTPHWSARGVSADLTSQQLQIVSAAIPGVKVQAMNEVASTIEPAEIKTTEKTRQPLWNLMMCGSYLLAHQRNLTGSGVLISVLGLDYPFDHPALKDRITYFKRIGPPPARAESSPHRATEDLPLMHPLGVLTGKAPDREISTAPGIQVALATLPRGKISSSNVISALEWLMEPVEGKRPYAVLICCDFNGPVPGPVRQSIRSCRNAGVLPILPAGNNPGSIGGMAALPECVAIGALDQWKSRALFSGQGPVIIDQMTMMKPDFAEPGQGIYGPSLDPSGFKFGSGTVQAAAHFAGVWAQLCEARPEETIESLLGSLATTSLDIGETGMDNATGHGLPDPVAALYLLENPPPPPIPNGPYRP